MAHAQPTEQHHPGPWEYIRIAALLAVITAAEVALYYIKSLPKGIFVTLLFFFSIVKFALVALYFMHLKFDAKIFRRLFVMGLVLAMIVYAIVLLTFGLLR